ncbi:hypothetical protein K523DRAFT_416203 [Schizophyllum commune Tattone D]|nr:hypothetical protein K523DRAFT_416203 [Schizophyllum commune Tattone D]
MPVSQFLQNTTLKTELCPHCGSCISATVLDASIEAVRSCELPNEREAAVLESSCVADEEDIAAYDAAIARVQTIVDGLREQRRSLRKNWGRKRTLLAPIRRLPTEILAQIISLAVMRTFRKHRDSTVVTRHPALQVCQRWRDLAIQMPELWANIVAYTCCTYSGWTDDISNCLSRSKDVPLDLELCRRRCPWHSYFPPHVKQRSSSSCELDKHEKSNRLVQLLLDAAPRWRTLHISDPLVTIAILLANPHLPLLESLDLSYSAGGITPFGAGDDWSAPLLSGTYRLTRVKLRVLSSFFGRLHLPWSRLTQLELKLWAMQTNTLGVLDQCKALTSLYFCITSFHYLHTDNPLVELPHLQTLTLADAGLHLICVLKAPRLQQITHLGPHLREANLAADDYFRYNTPLVRFAALNALELPLASLSLVMSYWGYMGSDNASLWKDALWPFTDLRYLCVSSSEKYSDEEALPVLLRTLACTPDLLPHLKRLHLPNLIVGRGDHESEGGKKELMEFIANRSAGMVELEVERVEGEELLAYCTRQALLIYAQEPKALRRMQITADGDGDGLASSEEEFGMGIDCEWDEA